MTVAGVLAIVDRQMGGRETIERALAEVPTSDSAPIPTIHTLFTANDVRRAHIALKK